MEQLLVLLNKRSYQLEEQFSPSVQLNIPGRWFILPWNDISALPDIRCPRYCGFILALSTPSTLLVPKQTPLQLLLLLIWRHVNTICISKTFSCHKPYFGNLVLMVTETCLSLQKNTELDLSFWGLLSVFVQNPPLSLVQESKPHSYWCNNDRQMYLCSFLTVDFLIFGYFTLWSVFMLPLFWFWLNGN